MMAKRPGIELNIGYSIYCNKKNKCIEIICGRESLSRGMSQIMRTSYKLMRYIK